MPPKIKREYSAQSDTSTITRMKITNEDLIEGIFIACVVALLAFGVACLIQMMRTPLSISIIN